MLVVWAEGIELKLKRPENERGKKDLDEPAGGAERIG